MRNLITRQVLLLISLILLLFSCSNNEIKPLFVHQTKVVSCRIITSSETQIYKLLDTNVWQSSVIGKDELIVFSFFEQIYIDKMSVNQVNSNGGITKIKVYSDNGYINEFTENIIPINQIVSFLIVKIEETNDFLLTEAYLDNQKYSIAFNDLNSSVLIKQIKFWENDSTQLQLNVVKSVENEGNLPNFIPVRKIIDYTNNKKSLTFKHTGEIIGFVEGANADTFYYGTLNSFSNTKKTADFSVKKCIFTDNICQQQSANVLFWKDGNVLKSNNLNNFWLDFNDDFFVDVATFDTTIVHDIRYATDNNFMDQVIYDCPYCLFRYKAAKDLKLASEEFQTVGYRIKVFDCYRPHSAQYKLWDILPNINYVANPDKGSIHNRGAAVDLTLVDSSGKQLNMGTEFDYFGFPAYSINLSLPDSILQNRFLLWETMNKYGFREIKTEWWHMSHYSCLQYPISEMDFPCND